VDNVCHLCGDFHLINNVTLVSFLQALLVPVLLLYSYSITGIMIVVVIIIIIVIISVINLTFSKDMMQF